MKIDYGTYILLLRHGESYKNIKSIHGGVGEKLTQKGREQVLNAAKRIKELNQLQNEVKIFSIASIHTVETSRILANCLGTDFEILADLTPLNMGVFNGLSDAEMQQLYPMEYESLLLWRRREIDISQLSIPEMEDVQGFWQRGICAMRHIESGLNIFVLTNSLYILITNILLGRGIMEEHKYRHIAIENCDMIIFLKKDDANYVFLEELSDIPLERL